MSSTFSQRRRAEGSSRSAARRPQQSRRGEEDSLDLPAYEPPQCPLTGPAQRALRDLVSSRINEKYREGLVSSASLLSNSVYVINERLTNRKRAAAQIAEKVAKRKNTGDGGDADADAAAAAVEKAEGAARELEDEVSAMSSQVEEAMRQVLDMQAALQDEKGILGDLPGVVAAKQQAVAGRVLQEQEEDDDVENQDAPEIPGVPILDVLQEERDAKAAEYEKLRPYEKYALNNSYIEFKKSWHQGLYPDEEVPLPDATKWFDQDGRPRQGTREDGRRTGGDDGEENSDDDIQIAREKRSFKCPLSLSTMKEPYTCRLCKHSFDRSSIFEYIKGPNGRGTSAKCPIPGCRVDAMTIKDLYLDEALLRRMKRAAQAEREEQDRSSGPEDEGEEVDEEVDDPPSAAVRSDIKAEAEAEEDV